MRDPTTSISKRTYLPQPLSRFAHLDSLVEEFAAARPMPALSWSVNPLGIQRRLPAMVPTGAIQIQYWRQPLLEVVSTHLGG